VHAARRAKAVQPLLAFAQFVENETELPQCGRMILERLRRKRDRFPQALLRRFDFAEQKLRFGSCRGVPIRRFRVFTARPRKDAARQGMGLPTLSREQRQRGRIDQRVMRAADRGGARISAGGLGVIKFSLPPRGRERLVLDQAPLDAEHRGVVIDPLEPLLGEQPAGAFQRTGPRESDDRNQRSVDTSPPPAANAES